MTLEIKVGPPQLSIHHGHCVLVTDQDGGIPWPSDKGFYVNDTRLVSNWDIQANGTPWRLLNSGTPTYYAARIFLTNEAFLTEDGTLAANSLALSIGRTIGSGIHEDLDVTNHGQIPARFNLEVILRADFADIFEVKSTRIVRRGRIATAWSGEEQRLTTWYRNQDFYRALIMHVGEADSPALYANGRLSFAIELPPGAHWHACLLYDISLGAERGPEPNLRAPRACIAEMAQSRAGRDQAEWAAQVLKLHSSNNVIQRIFDQAVSDMAALRLPIIGTDQLQFVPAAGLPWFVALFGRDSLLVSLQNMLVYPEFARGALEVLGNWQAHERDDRRDAEPGKILHELRIGELAHFKLIPHTPYYGTADATPLYLIVLHAAWRCTGDASLLTRHLPNAEACLEWIDRDGDRDGDGFQEYATRSPSGYENQGWKDAGEALVYPDGSQVRGPKALCELQGYVYDAWCRMAEIYDALGKPERAAALREKAARLFQRFNEVFWNEAEGCYIFALDGEKQPVATVASNTGQCLWSGIATPERARRVAERLQRPDMWSGWGIRTLTTENPSYNPHSYQNGSVWPHDNGFIALGFSRYGLSGAAADIARDVTAAASFFALNQLPELYAGLPRSETGFPIQYVGANVPQAWAAGSVFALLQALLGFHPDAPNRRLYLNPHLPDWLPDLELQDLRVGDQMFHLRFTRTGEKTEIDVLGGDPGWVVRGHPADLVPA